MSLQGLLLYLVFALLIKHHTLLYNIINLKVNENGLIPCYIAECKSLSELTSIWVNTVCLWDIIWKSIYYLLLLRITTYIFSLSRLQEDIFVKVYLRNSNCWIIKKDSLLRNLWLSYYRFERHFSLNLLRQMRLKLF